MCGLVSVMRNVTAGIVPAVVESMVADVSHRRPDAEGIVFLSTINASSCQLSSANGDWNVAMGSRRLSILDLSAAGHMPMVYRDTFWLVYNGEVYNFIEIHTELEQLGHCFHSSSDTEVILAAYAQWGTDSFARLRGMWGLVLIDGMRNEAIICRDRLGIKPLYLWQGSGVIAVVSEIKQLLHMPGFTPRVNLATVAEYLQTGYEDQDRSFFQEVKTIPPGCWLRLPLKTLVPAPPVSYWHPERIQVTLTDSNEAGRLFADKLQESISLHLRSDVPVGCALSGGLDSSAIAVLINALHDSRDYPLHTFTSTFPGDKTDEREYADAVVAHIRAVSHYVTSEPEIFLSELTRFVFTHDEPVGGLSIYASYCIARLTREAGVPVMLNGQGGDEILSGYWQSYFMHLRALAKHWQLLPLMHHFVGAMNRKGNPQLLAQLPVMLRRYRARCQSNTLVPLRAGVVQERAEVLNKVLALDEQAWRVEEIRRMFLPRLLKWDDRNSMAFSVEGRYPFLDHQLIELCLSFAPQTLYHWGWTKWPLRIGLRRLLTEKISNRRTKLGFEIPQESWLCGPLRPELERWFRQERPLWEYVEQAEVQRLAHEVWQLGGKRNEPAQALFRLFIFDRWAEVFGVVK